MPGGNGESLKDGFLSKPTTANRIICNTHYTAHNYIYPITDYNNPTAYVQVSIFGHVNTHLSAVQG